VNEAALARGALGAAGRALGVMPQTAGRSPLVGRDDVIITTHQLFESRSSNCSRRRKKWSRC
jgi:hypothetical protein